MKTLIVLAAALACASAQAQTIYRCGTSYSQTPCTQGRTVVLNADRNVQQQQEAIEVAARERALGDALEQDRRLQEAQQRPAAAGRIDGRVGHASPWRSEPLAKARGKKTHTKPAPRHPAERYKAVPTAGV